MLLQGNLQMVFDVLHNLGVIDPVLQLDWSEALETLPEHSGELTRALQVVSEHQQDPQKLQSELQLFDERTLEYLAMEVAREFASYHSRESLH